MYLQFTREQHGFELSLFICGYFSVVNTALLQGLVGIHGYKTDHKLYVD